MERFFILGCQRSGTTLLRLILEAHPDVVCYDEMKGYAILRNSRVESCAPARLVGFKLPRWTEQMTKPVLWDEGEEGSCRNFYRGEKILFLQRDPRDTIASMLKLKTGRTSWCETWVPRVIQAKAENDGIFRERYASELSFAAASPSRLVALAALYWKYKNDALYEYRGLGLPVIAVSYEELVQRPRAALAVVCRHLGISYHDNLLRHNELPHTELFENGLTIGNTDPTKPIRADSVGQWRRFLSVEDLRAIDAVIRGRAEAAG